MIVGIVADSHDHLDNIRKVLQIFKERNVETILHAGDFISPFALSKFINEDFRFVGVFGNNDGDKAALSLMAPGKVYKAPHWFDLDGKKFLLTHDYSNVNSIGIKSDFIICGHTHQLEVKDTPFGFLINPGDLSAWVGGKSTAVILDTIVGNPEVINI
ncbi:MAG: metallophosphoesterase [Pseudomonadota bacterium]